MGEPYPADSLLRRCGRKQRIRGKSNSEALAFYGFYNISGSLVESAGGLYLAEVVCVKLVEIYYIITGLLAK